MARILAFAGSNSSTSINYKLVKYSTSLIIGHEVELINMVDYNFPIFSEDLEREEGYSDVLHGLKDRMVHANALILSVNEHNGNPSAFFKNVLDWLSRVDRNFLADTKIFLMSCSGGRRGGAGSLEVVKGILPRFGGEIIATFSLPSFNHTFDTAKGITDPELAKAHKNALETFLSQI
ncbi:MULTISPECIES: NADPH-dependent FMN reductase [unclassified Arenibacter]|jgi:NAD(P)H-dependent FMN reductase|uniref:NADPH-dependent FMN reductase n=1 Tax=unclassified Arenibacter TaxID=2615047 RepID=UPI000E346A4D|nr:MULTISPECIES: NAD(P)H-dependent oxidoreductase [unclassified Arenibacter]MCM4163022.1 NADPH-dependent FMN reductase [Arenibacter sp. A80]RFT57060.1 NADPH-dependent oxidoreductase [Arenibacter sp. P308M17]